MSPPHRSQPDQPHAGGAGPPSAVTTTAPRPVVPSGALGRSDGAELRAHSGVTVRARHGGVVPRPQGLRGRLSPRRERLCLALWSERAGRIGA